MNEYKIKDWKAFQDWICEVTSFIDGENSSCRYTSNELKELTKKIYKEEYSPCW